MRYRSILKAALAVAVVLWIGGTTVEGQESRDPSLEELKRRLEDANFGVRCRALGYIGSMKPYPKEIAPDVIRCLKDPDYHVRADAANALGNLQNVLPDLGKRFPQAVPQLRRMLSDRDPEDKYQLVRRSAAYALGHLCRPSQPAVPELRKIAADKGEGPSVRSEAVQALGRIGHASPEVVATLTDLLDDPARINENYATVGSLAAWSLSELGADAKAALPLLISRLKHRKVEHRMAAAQALGTVGFGSRDAEDALLDLLDDKSPEVQQVALSSLEGINETYAFFFRNNVSSREVDKKQQALLAEIRRDDDRKARFVQILAAQLRMGKGHHPRRVSALLRLVDLDARDSLPLIKEQFDRLEKKTVLLEFADLRMQLLRTLAAWLPDKEIVPFLVAVDSDADEAPQVRFRAAALLCERGDAESIAHIVKAHWPQAEKTKPLMSIEALQKSLQDRRLFATDEEFASLKPVTADQLASIQKGLQLARYLYEYQRRGKPGDVSPTKVRLDQGRIDSIHFSLTAPSELWSFELRKQGEWWLPHEYRMVAIE